jgi:glutathione peroxidase
LSIYDITVQRNDGTTISLDQYRGQVLRIVNTATKCGFTPQYTGLQNLYSTFHDKGFELLDFPCNQFAHQAPGTDEEIENFCTLNFNTTFPRFAKIDVNGAQESPLYTYLKAQKSGDKGADIQWNFTKFLVDKDGQVVARFESAVKPEAIEKEIAQLLES